MKTTLIGALAILLALAVPDARGETEAQKALKKKLATTIVGVLNVEDAKLRDVAKFLAHETRGQINIVVMDKDRADTPTVTMDLRNMPLDAVLRFVCESTGSQLRIEDHAVVIVPPKAAPPNTYSVKLKIGPVKDEPNQFMVEFKISEKLPDGKENLLSAPKITILAAQQGTVQVTDEGERNGVICTATVTPKANELHVDTSVTIKRDGQVLWSCDQQTIVAKWTFQKRPA